MKIGKRFKAFSVAGFAVLGLAVFSAPGQIINQSGGSGTTYTGIDEAQGSANALRAISFATIANDANNLYITLGINPTGNLATGGAFNYIIGITTGNPSAGGDLSTDSTTHGNAYDRDISFSSAFGGMTDFIGIFGAGGSGSTSSPYTSYGFNDYVFGTPTSTSPTGVWTKSDTVSSGEPLSDQPSTSIPNEITITVPFIDFKDNLSLTPGTTIDFDIDSTGTSANTTAYGSLADPSLIQPGVPAGSSASPYSGSYQFNETELDQYTITAVPEPGTLALFGISGLSTLLAFWRRK
jgi:hypothetical protein